MARILAVDDEPGLRAFAADALADTGHDVCEAGDAAEALRMLDDRPFDLMLLDLRMPGELSGMDVRELANTLERATILAEGDTLHAHDLPVSTAGTASHEDGRTMAEIERAAIRRALDEEGGNRRRAAQRLGIGVRTLYEKLKRYDIA